VHQCLVSVVSVVLPSAADIELTCLTLRRSDSICSCLPRLRDCREILELVAGFPTPSAVMLTSEKLHILPI
jgi:hypothetical protein